MNDERIFFLFNKCELLLLLLLVKGVCDVPVTIPTPLSPVTSIIVLLCSLLFDLSVTFLVASTDVPFELVFVTDMLVVCDGAA